MVKNRIWLKATLMIIFVATAVSKSHGSCAEVREIPAIYEHCDCFTDRTHFLAPKPICNAGAIEQRAYSKCVSGNEVDYCRNSDRQKWVGNIYNCEMEADEAAVYNCNVSAAGCSAVCLSFISFPNPGSALTCGTCLYVGMATCGGCAIVKCKKETHPTAIKRYNAEQYWGTCGS